jgi:DNA-binding transcriptional MerR regulator
MTSDQKLHIGSAADLLGVSRKTLRYYEKIGLVMPQREENGYRFYGPQEMLQLLKVRQLQSLGISLEQIEELLHRHGGEKLWETVLSSLLDEIDTQLESLRARRQRVEGILEGRSPDPLNARGEFLPDIPRLQEYLQEHLNPKMWLEAQDSLHILEAINRADNHADILAQADLIITLAQSNNPLPVGMAMPTQSIDQMQPVPPLRSRILQG